MAERGLGTPATRAATIEGLIAQKYLARDGRELYVSGSGMRLIDLVREMDIEGLYSPKLTGDWEFKLRQMEHGQLKRERFHEGDHRLHQRDRHQGPQTRRRSRKKPSRSPTSRSPARSAARQSLRQTDATYECREPECKFKAKKHIAGRLLTEEEAIELFTTKLVGPLTGFKSKFNKPFDAALEMDAKFKINFVFENDDRDGAARTHRRTTHRRGDMTDGRQVLQGLRDGKGLSRPGDRHQEGPARHPHRQVHPPARNHRRSR